MKFSGKYFLAIAAQGLHTFVMIGVSQKDNMTLFARAGKGGIQCIRSMPLFFGCPVPSNLWDEGLSRNHHKIKHISYQAYEINDEQLKQGIALLKEIERKQWEDPETQDLFKGKYDSKRFLAYVPTTETSEFELRCLKNCPELRANPSEALMDDIRTLQLGSKTCRTAGIKILEEILDFAIDVSHYFIMPLKYKTTLRGGIPDSKTFYIFPAPPVVYSEHLTPKQFAIAKELYKRLEKIPLINPSASATRKKFNALKALYTNLVGANNLSAEQLLISIRKHMQENREVLFKKRGFFSQVFNLSSTTEDMLNEITEDLDSSAP